MAVNARRASSGNGGFLISTSRSQQSVKPEYPLPPRPRIPALRRLHKFRTILLPMLLVLTFTTLVLGAIYAYCVAKPHTDIANQLAVNSTAEANSSIFGKRETGAITDASKKTTDSSHNDEPETALLFYTLTVPVLSLFHLVFELIMHHHTPQHLSLKSIYITLITTSTFLICGWITSLSFWMHCELPTFNQDKATQGVCPAQVRGHFMFGIHEVSIARIAVGWAIVVIYIVHVLFLGMGFKAQKRIWRIVGTNKEVEAVHGEARMITVRFDEGSSGNNVGLAKEANVV